MGWQWCWERRNNHHMSISYNPEVDVSQIVTRFELPKGAPPASARLKTCQSLQLNREERKDGHHD
jgi:hypothetical protein